MSCITDSWNKSLVYTVQGLFTNNTIVTPDGETIPCITYNSLKQECDFEFGYYNLVWEEDIKEWVVIQFVPVWTLRVYASKPQQ